MKIPSNTSDIRVIAFEEEIVRVAIGVGMHEDRPAWLSIAARAPDLLVVRLQAPRQGGVDDGTDVGLINSHSEGDRRNHDFDFAPQEFLLDPFSMFGIEARVICRSGNETTKFLGQGAGLLARWRVDDSWSMPGIEHQFTSEFSPLRRRNLDHLDGDIRSSKPMNKPLRLCEPQLFSRYRPERAGSPLR